MREKSYHFPRSATTGGQPGNRQAKVYTEEYG